MGTPPTMWLSIHHYAVDGSWYLGDLPGYTRGCKNLVAIFVRVDGRREQYERACAPALFQ
jgi:hypothetical protein